MINLPYIRLAVVITFTLVLADMFLPYFPWQRYLPGQVAWSGNTKDQLPLFQVMQQSGTLQNFHNLYFGQKHPRMLSQRSVKGI